MYLFVDLPSAVILSSYNCQETTPKIVKSGLIRKPAGFFIAKYQNPSRFAI